MVSRFEVTHYLIILQRQPTHARTKRM